MGKIVAEYTNVNNVLLAEAVPVAQIMIAANGTKVDPNSLESAAPTTQGDYQRLTLTNHTVVGTTMDQALTYTVPLIGLDSQAATISFSSLIRYILKAGEAAPTDVRIWCGLSMGGVAAANKGMAIGIGYSAGSWAVYRASNAAGSAWSAASLASAVDATTMAVLGSAQWSAAASQATHGVRAMTSALAQVNVANTGFSTALTLASSAFTHFFIGADWITGSGGSDGETIDLKAINLCQQLTTIPNVT